jgi:hypothetical protein
MHRIVSRICIPTPALPRPGSECILAFIKSDANFHALTSSLVVDRVAHSQSCTCTTRHVIRTVRWQHVPCNEPSSTASDQGAPQHGACFATQRSSGFVRICLMLTSTVQRRRSPAQKLQAQLQQHGIDSLQSAVLSPSRPSAKSGGPLRRSTVASAQTGLTGTWKKDKVLLRSVVELRQRHGTCKIKQIVPARSNPVRHNRHRHLLVPVLQAASEPMDAACDAVQLGWVLRRALGLLSTLEVEDTAATFTTRIKAGGVMDVVERCRFIDMAQNLLSVSSD